MAGRLHSSPPGSRNVVLQPQPLRWRLVTRQHVTWTAGRGWSRVPAACVMAAIIRFSK